MCQLPRRWRRVISVLGGHVHAWADRRAPAARAVHQHFDTAISADRWFTCYISQSVLVSSVSNKLGVCVFNSSTREGIDNFAACGTCVLRQNVAVAESRQVQFLDLVVDGNSRSANAYGIYHDVVREQYSQHIAIACVAAILAPVTDDENHLSPGLVAPGEI